MIVLDTNMIVAILDKKDAHHKNAVRILEDLGDERVYILNTNLSETYSVIARRCRERNYDCKAALGKLRELEASINVIWVENLKEIHAEVVDGVIESNGELNYNDALLLRFVKDEDATLITANL
ncbi:MAG: type II toxin-antitoxin system VapC family toxin [Thermodesulfobacteriota bacterium]